MADGWTFRVAGSEAQTDQGSTVWRKLGLPTVVGLILPHCYLALGVPLSSGRALKVILVN